MSLTTRLLVFFLLALAVVLVGFSVSLYGLAHFHLFHRLDERARAVLGTLRAAIEVEKDGLEWDPGERILSFQEGTPDPVVWAVFDENGQDVNRSEKAEFLSPNGKRTKEVQVEDASWRVHRWTASVVIEGGGTSMGTVEAAEKGKRYLGLTLVVGVASDPTQTTLDTLGLTLAGLSLLIWVGSALLGYWLCRRALAPLTRMTQSARSITAADLTQRLPETGTADELADLRGAFNDLLTRLQDSFERQGRFTGEASHQLRTPLTAILGQVEIALRRDRAPEDYQRVLLSIQKQSTHLHHLVEMLLFLARADTEGQAPDLQPLDLGAWLRDYLLDWHDHPRHADLHLLMEEETETVIAAHAELLGQALDNLLDNACKYSPPSTPIELRLWRRDNRVCLSVKDQGNGIANEDLPHLFDPFFRSTDARQRGIEGVGLGLAVTRRIVNTLRGEIEVVSRMGDGSEFILSFICSPSPPNPLSHGGERGSKTGTEAEASEDSWIYRDRR